MRTYIQTAASIVAVGVLGWCASLHGQDPFPAATTIQHGVSEKAIELLDEHVETIIERGEAVGAELHIIKDRKTILHKAYGWSDRDAKQKLETDSIYCVRSMTKPLVGTAIQILIDDGKLSLNQRVSEVLKEFDTPDKRDITIKHLLTHTSGLPFSVIARPLSEFDGLREVARDAASAELNFEPGTSFQYSDAGSDSLGAIVEVVSGEKVEEYMKRKILQPLGMSDSLLLLDTQSPLDRIPSAYSGGTAGWKRHWKSSDQPIFPFFLSSQSLYSTTSDYARFIAMWTDGGQVDGKQIISSAAVKRALSPGKPIGENATEFRDLHRTYGFQWVVDHAANSKTPTVFGHNGSDGTHSWVWPERDLIVLFFTQSRGTTAGTELEPILERLLIEGDVDGFARDSVAERAARETLQPYTGIYWDQDVEDAYYAISIEKNQLVFERPGRVRAVAAATSEKGHFKVGGSMKIEFESDTTPATAMLMTTRRTERQVRHAPESGLSSIEDVIEKMQDAHGINRLEDSGIIKLSGNITMGPLKQKGKLTQWFAQRNMRSEIKIGTRVMTVISNGKEVMATGLNGSLERLEGIISQQHLLAHPAIQFGDWRRGYAGLEVLKRLDKSSALLIRAKAVDMPGVTLIVDSKTGRLTEDHRIEYLPGMGFVGVKTRYSNFQDVAGMLLPMKVESTYATPFLGKIVIEFDDTADHVAVETLFDLSK